MFLAFVADHYIIVDFFYYSFTVLSGAKSYIRVFRSEIKLIDLFVVLLNVSRQIFEKIGAHVQRGWASISRAHDLFKIFDFVDDIMMQARFTKVEFMLAIAHVHF